MGLCGLIHLRENVVQIRWVFQTFRNVYWTLVKPVSVSARSCEVGIARRKIPEYWCWVCHWATQIFFNAFRDNPMLAHTIVFRKKGENLPQSWRDIISMSFYYFSYLKYPKTKICPYGSHSYPATSHLNHKWVIKPILASPSSCKMSRVKDSFLCLFVSFLFLFFFSISLILWFFVSFFSLFYCFIYYLKERDSSDSSFIYWNTAHYSKFTAVCSTWNLEKCCR